MTALARPEDWEEPRAAPPQSVAAAHRSAADQGRGGVTSALTHGPVPWDHSPFGIIQILFPERSVVPETWKVPFKCARRSSSPVIMAMSWNPRQADQDPLAFPVPGMRPQSGTAPPADLERTGALSNQEDVC